MANGWLGGLKIEGTLTWDFTVYHQYSMVYFIGNEAVWATVNQKKWRSQLSEDEMTEFLTKSGWKKCNNTQNILLGWSYLLFEEYLQEKNICLYTETGPRNRPKFWRNSKNLNLLIEVYLIRLSYDVKNYADLGGGRKQHAFSSSKILDIYSASFNNC